MNSNNGNQEYLSIYRFEADNSKRLEQLLDNKLYMSDPKEFNDPFDLCLSIEDKSDRVFGSDDAFLKILKFFYENEIIKKYYILNEEIESYIRNLCEQEYITKQNLTSMCSRVQDHILSFGVKCFSLSCDIPLQWAHYGNCHKGFCIEYGIRPMDFSYANPKLGIYEVTYTNKLPNVCISEVLFTPHQAIGKLLATKTLDWSYEQEIRIINFEQKKSTGVKESIDMPDKCEERLIDMPNGLQVKSLIAGAKMCKDHLILIKDIGQKLGVPVYKMRTKEKELEPLLNRELV